MKSNKLLLSLFLFGIFIVVFALVQALITATGAFHSDPTERVNRMDIVWAVIGLLIAVCTLYSARKLKPKS